MPVEISAEKCNCTTEALAAVFMYSGDHDFYTTSITHIADNHKTVQASSTLNNLPKSPMILNHSRMRRIVRACRRLHTPCMHIHAQAGNEQHTLYT